MGCGSSKATQVTPNDAPVPKPVAAPTATKLISAVALASSWAQHSTEPFREQEHGALGGPARFVFRRGVTIELELTLDGGVTGGAGISVALRFETAASPVAQPIEMDPHAAHTNTGATHHKHRPSWAIDPMLRRRVAAAPADPEGADATATEQQRERGRYTERVTIQLPATAMVGEYIIRVAYTTEFETSYDSVPAVVLFNPWCKRDDCYVPDPTHRAEYVGNEEGIIFWGSPHRVGPMIWGFGQFDPELLECALFLLRQAARGSEAAEICGDVVMLSRKLSGLVNANDRDNGVLVGKWSGDYDDGVRPTAWSSSIAVVDAYMKPTRGAAPTEPKSVKYGQCFVFAGVLTSLLRCLGVGCRPVSCFSSAHDGDDNGRIEKYFDSKGGASTTKASESIWNYHVWVEAWFARGDLPAGYGGWQAVDGTPQERSDGVFQCGPASITALKKADTAHGYDVPFVLGEVNADIYYYLERPDGDGFQLSSIDETQVAPFVLTKTIGPIDFEVVHRATPAAQIPGGVPCSENVVGHYKYPERTAAERATILAAQPPSHRPHLVDFVFSASHDDSRWSRPPVGSTFSTIFTADAAAAPAAGATAAAGMTVHGRIEVHALSSTGKAMALVRAVDFAGETLPLRHELEISPEMYKPHLQDSDFVFEIRAFAEIDGPDPKTNQVFMRIEKIMLEAPTVEVAVASPGKIVVDGEGARLNLVFENPLDEALSNAVFHVDGVGLLPAQTIAIGTVMPKHRVVKELGFSPHRVGHHTMVAQFESDQIGGNIFGSAPVTVEPAVQS